MFIYKDKELANELKERLSSLGLSLYEINAYLTLLRGGILTASELVKRSGIPHSRIYDIARKLSEKGLIEIIEGRPRKFKLVDPNIALRVLVEKKKRKLDKLCGDTLNIINIFALKGRLEDKTTWIVEIELADLTLPLLKRAKYQLLLAATPHLIAELKDELKRALRRGVNVTITSYGDLKIDDPFIKENAELYVRKAPSLTIVLVDANAGVISDPRINYSILTTEPILVRALTDLFYSSLIQTSKCVNSPSLKGRFISIWAIIHRLQGGERIRVKGVEVKTGREVVVEGTVEGKILDDGIASILLRTDYGVVKVGGIGAMLEDIGGVIFEIIS